MKKINKIIYNNDDGCINWDGTYPYNQNLPDFATNRIENMPFANTEWIINDETSTNVFFSNKSDQYIHSEWLKFFGQLIDT